MFQPVGRFLNEYDLKKKKTPRFECPLVTKSHRFDIFIKSLRAEEEPFHAKFRP